jgi:hypothetical protein
MQHAIPEGRSGYRLRTTCSRIARIHQNRLVEFVNPSGSQYQDTLKQMTDYFLAHGSSFAQAPQQAFTWTSQQVQLQASYLAYIDVFWLLSAAQDQLQIVRDPRDIKHHRIARFRVRNNLLSWKFDRRCVA